MSKSCPICSKAAGDTHAPFCSKRCADIDLGRWLKGGYAIPGMDGEALLPANDINPDADITFRDDED